MSNLQVEPFEHQVLWNGRQVLLRPVRSGDEGRYAAFYASLDCRRIDRGIWERMPKPSDVVRIIADGDERKTTLIAVRPDCLADESLLGIACAAFSADNDTAEIGIALRHDVEGQGLGRLLLGTLVKVCRQCGVRQLRTESGADNRAMIALARAFRFVLTPGPVPGTVTMRLPLRQPESEE